MSNKLTVIIPFLNEGVEVFNTISSIKNYVGNNVNIIIINDASTDKYDYKTLETIFDLTYIENSTRKGVAASRDFGISLSSTPYFLLLDAHMRFYSPKWLLHIISMLDENDRRILCCQTKMLQNVNKEIRVHQQNPVFGAHVNVDQESRMLDPIWNIQQKNASSTTESIPCILGAAYAGSKRYWDYLKGLQGLVFYGCDETYLSIKVWLEGGTCDLLKDIVVGHIYRSKFPYIILDIDIIYNKLFIAETLLPPFLRYKIHYYFKSHNKKLYSIAYDRIEKNSDQIRNLKNYYISIRKENIETILKMNRLYHLKNKDWTLNNIANHLLNEMDEVYNNGVFHGKMGFAIFFFLFANHTQDNKYKLIAKDLYDKSCNSIITTQAVVNFSNGLCGIGWAIEYLLQKEHINNSADKLLEFIDILVMERNITNITSTDIDYGLSGIVLYILTRLIAKESRGCKTKFNEVYLTNLFNTSSILLPSCKDKISYSILSCYIKSSKENHYEIAVPELTDFMDYVLKSKGNKTDNGHSLINGDLSYGLSLMHFQ